MRRPILASILLALACGGAPPRTEEPLEDPAPAHEAATAPASPPAATTPPAPEPPPPPTPLAARIGGREAIARLVHVTFERVGADRRLRRVLHGPDTADLEGRMTALLCVATAGTDCTPGAAALEPAQWGERLTDRDFDAFLEAFGAAMGAQGLGEVERNELLAVVGPLRATVVTSR